MTLTAEQQEDVREILAAVFSDASFKSPSLTPTDETLALTETLLMEIQECNRQIHVLFSALNCGIIGKGWLIRCTRGVKNIFLGEARGFLPCLVFARAKYLSPIKISMLG